MIELHEKESRWNSNRNEKRKEMPGGRIKHVLLMYWRNLKDKLKKSEYQQVMKVYNQKQRKPYVH